MKNNKLKYFLYGIGAFSILIALIIVISGIVLPETQEITCTSTINAPAYIVYKNISDLHQWSKWDPWNKLDKNQIRTYEGIPSTVGHQYAWEGNDQVGKGSMQITALEKNKMVEMALHFIKPFESKPKVEFVLTPKNNSTEVSWKFISKNPFLFRLVSQFMKPVLIKSFNEGLSNLKNLSEKEATENPASANNGTYEIHEMQLSSKTYLVIRNKEQSIKTMSEFFMNEMPKAFIYLQQNKKELAGYPSGLYYSYDENKGISDVAIALPFEGSISVSKPYENITLAASKAISIDYYGAYDQMEGAYDALYDYIEKNNLEQQGPAIEEYIGDPQALNGDMSKCLTKIYIPIK